MKLAFVFPGQGSQKVGMADWVKDSPAASAVMQAADQALGESISTLIAEGPDTELNLTVNTQPALLATSYAVFAAWREAGGAMPEVMAGHSLGEYTALTAAGVFSVEDAVRLVRFRANAMQSAVPVGVGGMAAILGLADDVVTEICAKAAQSEAVEAVNFNCPGQVVIAGHKQAVERACDMALEAGAKRAVVLAVSAPFHSALLEPAAKELAGELAHTAMKEPVVDVVANVDVTCHKTVEEIRTALAKQAASPVLWTGCVKKMQEMGVTHIVECGPGRVLAGLVRRIAPEITVANVSDLESIQKVVAQLNA